MDIRHISILGSTGSIGRQALDVVERLGLKVEALSVHKNIRMLEQQIRKYHPAIAAVMDEGAARELRQSTRDCGVKIVAGIDGLCEAAAYEGSDLVLNAVVGMIGLRPTLAAIRARKNVALANKETLVAGGSIVMSEAKKNGVAILPVDSEHSAIFQCIQGSFNKDLELKKIILTASGGPFFGLDAEKLKDVTPSQALCHPNWSMGPKITVDCATLMNKGLELIEAVWLFGLPPEKIEIVVHRESVVHSMVEFCDHSIIAQLGPPDMRLPIQYAITYPERFASPVGEIDFFRLQKLSFYRPDEHTFKCLRLCRKAIQEGGLLPAAANAANEKAVELFLGGKIKFTEIGDLVEDAVINQEKTNKNNIALNDILETDRNVKIRIAELAGR